MFNYPACQLHTMASENPETNELGECPSCGHRFNEDDVLDGPPPLYGEPTVRCPNYDGTNPNDPHREVFKELEGTPHSIRVSNLKVDKSGVET